MDAVSRLHSVYFLEHLTPQEFDALALMMHLQRYVAGDKILTQGEATKNFFIVDDGHVNLRHTDRSGFERAVSSKGPGDYFGIKMFTTQEPSDYTFEAVDAAGMWVVERQDWDRLLEHFPNVLDHMPELREEYARLTRGLDWLAPGEVIDLSTRRHWWALLLMIRLPFAVALVFTIAFVISNVFGVTTTLLQVTLVYFGVLGVIGLWVAWEALNWWNDTYIVTNKRVVRINKVLFFSDSRQELAIEKIQSQRVDRGGPISVLLNISDLRITSAASESAGLVFEQVGDVAQIQKAIDNERLHVAERKSAAERERLRNQIAGEIRHYVFQQPAAPEPAPSKYTYTPSTATKGWRLPRLWRRRPARTKMISKPAPLGKRLRGAWQALIGTEMRQGKVVTWRKHHIVLLDQTFPAIASFVVLALLTAFFMLGGLPLSLSSNGIYAVLGLLMLAALGYFAWQWEDWRRDLYRLSDTEIVDIESLPFGLRYTEKKAEIKNIQDVKTERPRLVNTLFDFGNVDTRVAGSAAPFTFTSVARPQLVADEIAERIELFKLRNTERVMREQTRSVVDAIVAYHRLMMAERHQAPTSAPTTIVAPAVTPQNPPTNLESPTASVEDKREFPPEDVYSD